MRYPAVQCVSLLRNSSRNSKQPAFAGRLPEKEWAPITEIGEKPLGLFQSFGRLRLAIGVALEPSGFGGLGGGKGRVLRADVADRFI
jgi:hypothetical protein